MARAFYGGMEHRGQETQRQVLGVYQLVVEAKRFFCASWTFNVRISFEATCFFQRELNKETPLKLQAKRYLSQKGTTASHSAMEWLGQAKISFIHSPNPLQLKTKDGSSTDLLKICEASTPPCHLNPLLFNGHLQTIWTAIKNDGPALHYKRKIFQADDPNYEGTFAVDFVIKASSDFDDTLPIRTTYFSDDEFDSFGSLDDRPMLVTLHGLSGGSYEVYLKHVLAPLTGLDGEGRWEACVVNSRGCAMSKITSTVLFNARATWDCQQTVSWLRKKFPNRPLFGIGFSLGANILTNYIAEQGPSCMLRAAVVISNPWNLDTGSLALQRTWIGREVYSKTMGANMKRLIELHYDQVSKNPDLDFEKIRKVKYLHEFDREVQGPTWGYPTEGMTLPGPLLCPTLTEYVQGLIIEMHHPSTR